MDIIDNADEQEKKDLALNTGDIAQSLSIINDPNSSQDEKIQARQTQIQSTVNNYKIISEILGDTDDVKNSFDVFTDPNFNPSIPWESQPSELQEKINKLKTSKIWQAVEDKIKNLKNIVNTDDLKILSDALLNQDNAKAEITAEKMANDIGNKLSDEQKNKIEKDTGFSWKDVLKFMLKLLAFLGAAFAAYKIFEMLNQLLCNMAKQDSGCKVIDPNGNSSVLVWNQGLSCSATQDCTYDSICGGCSNATQLPFNSPPCCCSSAVDANAKNHIGWQYQYTCSNIWDQLTKLSQSLLSNLSPQNLLNNLEKIAKSIGIAIAIIFGIVILFYILKFGIKYVQKKIDSKESSEG